MRSIHSRAVSCTFVLLAILGSTTARAAILDLYHLGEADPGAVAGNTGNNPTIDSGPGAHNLPIGGAPTYSSNVGTPGSTLSMSFNGTSDDYLLSSPVTTLTNDVGISVDFPTANNIVATIAYNGDSGHNGFGLYQFNGSGSSATIIGLMGGVTLGNSVNVPLNQWTEVTQLIQGGQSILFTNHGQMAVTNGTPNAPTSSTPIFGIGGHGAEFFQGRIDEVTVFTTPEPSALAMFGLAAVGLIAAVRRGRGMNKRQ